MAVETEYQKALYEKQIQDFKAKILPTEEVSRQAEISLPQTEQSYSQTPEQLERQAEYTKQRGTEHSNIIQAQFAKLQREKLAAEQARLAAEKEHRRLLDKTTAFSPKNPIYTTPSGKPFFGNYALTQGDTDKHSKGHGAHAWDYGTPIGTRITSTIDGTVLKVVDLGDKSYGKYIVVRGVDGRQYYYAHLSGFHVKPGQRVKSGQVIGLSGSSGKSSGPHLHYEVRG